MPSDSAVRTKEVVVAAREQMATELRTDRGGVAILEQFARTVRDAVIEMSSPIVAEATRNLGPVALVAIGALGRRELGPHSDIDLVLLCGPGTADGNPELDELVARLVHPLWDAGLRPHITVQDQAAWLTQAHTDLSACSALLDVSLLAGDEALVDGMRSVADEALFFAEREPFLRRLAADLEDRHARYGKTVFLVEPDLKYGPGGLRDLASVGWSLCATHGTANLDELCRREVLRPRVAGILARCKDVLLRFRAAIQLAAKRSQERLVFQYQESIPPLFGSVAQGPIDDASLVRAVEVAMQEYYRAARDLVRFGERVRSSCWPRPPVPQEPRRVDERFWIIDGALTHREASAFSETPILAFDALALARRNTVPLSGDTFDAIAELAGQPSVRQLAAEPESQRRFLELLTDADDVEPSVLGLANELTLIDSVVPEFGPIRGRMQHDSYHVYTVDQHTLNAIAMLKRLARGEHNKDFPLATALHLEIDDPTVLYLATLLHDTGKALDGDQCETGAAIARTVAQRMGFSAAEVDRCARLVGEHLSMPLLSQKRDLSDPLLIGEFARRIGDRQTLKELYLLSLVDMAEVRPGNLTSWKLTLLDELYLRTCAYLRRGTKVVRRADEPIEMPDRYYSLFHLEMRRRHAELMQRLAGEGRSAVLELEQGSGALRLTLVAYDRVGLLAQTMAVLDDHGIEVLAADVFSTPNAPAIAVDVFRVSAQQDPTLGVDVQTITAVEQALQTGVDAHWLKATPPKRRRPVWKRGPSVPTKIGFEPDPAGERTIVEIETLSGPDVLRRITLAFAAESVEILLARCNREADRADNVFYVPRLNLERRETLRQRLREYLGADRGVG